MLAEMLIFIFMYICCNRTHMVVVVDKPYNNSLSFIISPTIILPTRKYFRQTVSI